MHFVSPLVPKPRTTSPAFSPSLFLLLLSMFPKNACGPFTLHSVLAAMVLPLSLTLPGMYTTDPLLSVSSSQCVLTDVCKYCTYFQPVFVPGEIFGGLERHHSHSSETKPNTSHVTKGSQDLGCRDSLVSRELMHRELTRQSHHCCRWRQGDPGKLAGQAVTSNR